MLGEIFRNGQRVQAAAQREEFLCAKLDRTRLPQHIAVIMDGNGRWANKRALPRLAGHRAGIESLREIVRNCSDLGIKNLTVFAFSTENWSRPKDEVSFLIKLLDEVLEREIQELHANGVRVRIIGRRRALPSTLQQRIDHAEALTRENAKLTLNVGFNYGGRAEIVDAAKGLVRRARMGELSEDDIDEAVVSQAMYSPEIPDPDLLIRTGGEHRISNFLLWQMAYAEIWLTPVFWPDFRRIHLLEALCEFQNRERRFGRL